jgi:hypothetical protein
MRLGEISSAQRQLLGELASGISDRLEAFFVEVPHPDGVRLGVSLHEGDRRVIIELPVEVLAAAMEGGSGREILRTRMKARRDRMMFRTPPRALPKTIAPLFSPGPPRSGGYRGGRR